MVRTTKIDGIDKEIIELSVQPSHHISPNIIGKPHKQHKGASISGFHRLEYALPNGDALRVIANDQKTDTAQLIIETRNAQLLQQLPSQRANSLVTNCIKRVEQYLFRALQYGPTTELTPQQQDKRHLCEQLLNDLHSLLGRERSLAAEDILGQELLRNDIIERLEQARDGNRLISDTLLTAEGQFNQILYETAHQYAQNYSFHQSHPIDLSDQLMFCEPLTHDQIINPCLKKILAKTDVTPQDTERLNNYFCPMQQCPAYNSQALSHLLASCPSLNKQKTQLTHLIKQYYPTIINQHPHIINDQSPQVMLWDSREHLNLSKESTENILQILCQHYGLEPATKTQHIEANRLKSIDAYIRLKWQQLRDFTDYLARKKKVKPHSSSQSSANLYFESTHPDYFLSGKTQAYKSLKGLIESLMGDDDASLVTCKDTYITITHNNTTQQHRYEKRGELYYLLPTGNDLLDLIHCNQNHLYLPQRIRLKTKTLLTNIAYSFSHGFNEFIHFAKEQLPHTLSAYFYQDHVKDNELRQLLNQLNITLTRQQKKQLNTLIESVTHRTSPSPASNELFALIHSCLKEFNVTHEQLELFDVDDMAQLSRLNHKLIKQQQRQSQLVEMAKQGKCNLEQVLRRKQLLSMEENLDDFLMRQPIALDKKIALPSTALASFHYNNPINRAANVLTHLSDFFIHYGEKHPIIGTLSTAFYLYGTAAVLAPHSLSAILAKLHLSLLAKGIAPTQALGKFMSHGPTSEAISAGMTYWQAAVLLGNGDRIMQGSIDMIQEDPIQVAAVISFAMALGYGLCEAFPPLKEEMGIFPYTNYLTLGAKGSAALYDTVSHPGEDFILGTIKWAVLLLSLMAYSIIGPFIEWAKFGFHEGFVVSVKKNMKSVSSTIKQAIAASFDLALSLTTLTLRGVTSFLIHIPFRGLQKVVTKTLATLGNLTELANCLGEFALRDSTGNYFKGFRISPLYYFTNPLKTRSNNAFIDALLNTLALFLIPPLEVIKNFVLLPSLDLLSLSTRLIMTLFINPLSRMISLMIAAPLYLIAKVSDPTLGKVFKACAHFIIRATNAVDQIAGQAKRELFSLFNWIKISMRLWAYPKPASPPKKNYFSTLNNVAINESQPTVINELIEQVELKSTSPSKEYNPSFFKHSLNRELITVTPSQTTQNQFI